VENFLKPLDEMTGMLLDL